MKILLTSGATREPIDAVRFISNVSTGRTGAHLAAALAARGHAVTLLHGPGAVLPAVKVGLDEFSSATDLELRLGAHLSGGAFDAVIMAAAVADYRPAQADPEKMSSNRAERTLRLVRNPKLLPRLKKLSPRPLRVIGFKLTAGGGAAARTEAVERQFADGKIDAIVHNDLEEIKTAAVHPFHFFPAAGKPPALLSGVAALAEALDAYLKDAR